MDKGNSNRVICFGEVLWDNLPTGKRIGGAPLNVCYHLNQHGIAAEMISQVGVDQLGKELRAGISALNIKDDYIADDRAHNTSIVQVHLHEQGEVSYEIVADVAWDYIAYHPEIAQIVQESSVFVFGSLAARHTKTRETLFRYLPLSPWTVFDVNLRQDYFSKDLIISLIEQTKTLKVNAEELLLIASWLGFGEHHVQEYPALLLQRFPLLQEIILTKGAEGAYFENRDVAHSIKASLVSVVDTVGAGDSFLAAFLAKKLQGNSLEEALAHGAKISGFVASCAGACPAYPEDLLG